MKIGIKYHNELIDTKEAFGIEYVSSAYDMQINIENLKEIILEKLYDYELKENK